MDDLVVTSSLVIPARDLSFTATRASGAGGQNVNKVASKVDLRFDLAGTTVLDESVKRRLRKLARLDAHGRIVVVSQVTRDQPRNLEDARARLVALIRKALTPPRARKPTKATRGSERRRLEGKRQQSEKKRTRRKPDLE